MRKKSQTSSTIFDRGLPGQNNPVDIHIGARLRLRRTLLGYSQEKLGEAVGLTFQQIQKYERGANRMGGSRIFQFSQILDVPVAYFFDDIPEEWKTNEGMSAAIDHDPGRNPLARRETLELVRAYYKLTDPIRKQMFELIKTWAKEPLEEELPSND